ncbi:MAG: hypothetical protein WCH65_08395 [bacterium]
MKKNIIFGILFICFIVFVLFAYEIPKTKLVAIIPYFISTGIFGFLVYYTNWAELEIPSENLGVIVLVLTGACSIVGTIINIKSIEILVCNVIILCIGICIQKITRKS